MARLILFMAIMSTSGLSTAQQWWAPGACWTYETIWMSPMFHKYEYTSDTIIDGMDVQVATYTPCYPFPDTLYCGTAWPAYEWITWQGDAVLAGTANWDTLYYLGVPGDRWWPITTDESCPPYGMIEIQDTGHVVINGISLRTWELAILGENGQPMQTSFEADTFDLIERIGGSPRRIPPFSCDPNVIIDYDVILLRHYADNEISVPEGTNCDITTHLQAPLKKPTLAVLPNPGSDQVRVSGLTSATMLRLRDALGRELLNSRSIGDEAVIVTDGLARGPYFIEIGPPNGTRQVLRWVKE